MYVICETRQSASMHRTTLAETIKNVINRTITNENYIKYNT